MSRTWQQFVFTFEAGSTTSDMHFLGGGAFGTLIVPAALNGSTLNFVTDFTTESEKYKGGIADTSGFDGVDLLSADITLTTGANPLTPAQAAEVGAAGPVKLQLGAGPVAEQQVVLWWKD